jgi:predicted nuclease of predicted toxin-antitoxin system
MRARESVVCACRVKPNRELCLLTLLLLLSCALVLQLAVRANLAQTLVTACIDSDFDSSGNFSDEEIKILELRMKNVPGVKVNHELLVQTVHASDRKLESVLALLSQLNRTDLDDSQRIFQFDEDHLQTLQQQQQQ